MATPVAALVAVLAELSAAEMVGQVRLPLPAILAVQAVTPILLMRVPVEAVPVGVVLLMVEAEEEAVAAVVVEQGDLAEPVTPAIWGRTPHTTVFLLPAVQTTQ